MVRLFKIVAIGVAALLLAVGIYSYTCWYCTIFADSRSEPAHVTSLPSTCAVLTVPGPWITDDGPVTIFWRESVPGMMPNGDVVHYNDRFDRYDLLLADPGGRDLLISLKSTPVSEYAHSAAPRNAGNAYRIQHAQGLYRIAGEASQAEWKAAIPVEFRNTPDPYPGIQNPDADLRVGFDVQGGPLPGRGWMVFSLADFFYNPISRATIFLTGHRSRAEIRLWGCSIIWDYLRRTSTHGARFVTMPLRIDLRSLLLCEIAR